MSSVKQSLYTKGNETLSKVNAVNTALNYYPVLLETGINLFSGLTNSFSFSFTFDLLKILGVTEEEIIQFFSFLLSKKGGILDAIEDAIKSILLANFKNLLTCSISPFIPDKLMDSNYGLELNIANLDLYGLLEKCPTDSKTKLYYFDTDNMTPTTVKDSCDFNAVLWYAVHKGKGFPVSWDNRNKYYEEFKKDSGLKTAFRQASGTGSTISFNYNNQKYSKKEIFYIQYNDRSSVGNIDTSNTIKFWINPRRYKDTTTVIPKNLINPEVEKSLKKYKGKIKKTEIDEKDDTIWKRTKTRSNVIQQDVVNVASKSIGTINKGISLNKSIFEFNYDFLYSMKLFESNTLAALIIKNILTFLKTLSLSGTLEKTIGNDTINKLVNLYVKKAMNEDEFETDDDYYKFSNDEYETLLEETILYRKSGKILNNETNETDEIVEDEIRTAVEHIGEATNGEEEYEAINNALETISKTITENKEYTEITANLNAAGSWDKLFTILSAITTETMTQVVMQALSPKVYFLYIINSIISGDIEYIWDNESKTENDLVFKDPDEFIKSIHNVLKSVVMEIKELILEQIYNFILKYIKQLAVKYAMLLLKEKLNNYTTLIKELLSILGVSSNYLALYKSISDSYKNLKAMFGSEESESNLIITDVNYMDLVPEKEKPSS